MPSVIQTQNLTPKPQPAYKRFDATGALNHERSLTKNKTTFAYSTSEIVEPYLCGFVPSGFYFIAEAIVQLDNTQKSISDEPIAKKPQVWIFFTISLTIHDCPALKPWHNYDAKRPVDNDQCPACDASFNPPQSDGAEILAA